MRGILIVITLMLIAACSTTRYVPIESVRTEYRDREVEKIITDTVTSERIVFIKGDTVIDTRIKERVRYVEIRDTLIEQCTDTIKEVVEVERKLSDWERAKMDFGGAAMGAAALLLIILIKKLI